MKLYILRHGETPENIACLNNGWNETHLTEKGIEQAKEANNIVKQLPIDLIICSPLYRTRQTMKYATEGMDVPVSFDSRLKERNSKSMLEKPVSLLDPNIWYDKTKDIVYDDNEGFKHMLERVTDFFNEIKVKYNNKTILLVTHGDLMRAMESYFNPQLTSEDLWNISYKNCQLIEHEL